MAFSPNSYKTEKICFLASFFSLEIWRGAGFLYFQALGANSIPACTELNMDEDWATRFWFFFPFMPITEQREWATGNYCLSPQPWKSHFLSSQPKYRRNSQARKMWGNETEKNTDWQQCFQNKSGAPCLFQIIQEFKERFGLHFSKQVGSFIFLLPRLLTPNKKNLEKFHAKCRVFPGTEYTSYLDVDSGPSTSASDGQQPLSSGPLSAREERSWDHACQRWNGGREGRDWEATREMRLTSGRALGGWCPLGMLWFFLTERKHRLMEGRRALQVAYLAWSWLWDLRALGLGSNYPILWSLVSSRVKRRHKPVLKHPVLVISQEPISRWWCDEHVFHSNADLCPLHRWENWGYICNEDPKGHQSPGAWPEVRLISLVPSPPFLLPSFLPPLPGAVSPPILMCTQGTRWHGALPIRLPRERGPDALTVVSQHILFLSIFLKLPWVIFFRVKSSWKEWNESKTNTVWYHLCVESKKYDKLMNIAKKWDRLTDVEAS